MKKAKLDKKIAKYMKKHPDTSFTIEGCVFTSPVTVNFDGDVMRLLDNIVRTTHNGITVLNDVVDLLHKGGVQLPTALSISVPPKEE